MSGHEHGKIEGIIHSPNVPSEVVEEVKHSLDILEGNIVVPQSNVHNDVNTPADNMRQTIDILSSIELRKLPDYKTKQFVYCSLVKEGFHSYPEAATDPELEDVNYLSSRHQHYFTIKLWVEVEHTNRHIEFQQMRRWLDAQFTSQRMELKSGSCEMLSDQLYQITAEKFPNRDIRIDISEDGINGSYTEYTLVK